MDLRRMRGAMAAAIADPGEKRVGWGEMVAYLNAAQSAIEGMLWDIDRAKFCVEKTITAVNDQQDYTVDADVREIARVQYLGHESVRLSIRDSAVMNIGESYRATFGVNQFFSEIGQDSTGLTKIRLYPIPQASDGTLANSIKVWYYKTTRLLHVSGIYNGTVTTSGNVTQWIDINNPFFGSGVDFWSKNSSVRWKVAANEGVIRNVTAYVPASGLFSVLPAAPNAHVTPDTYELNQFSALPRQYHHLIVLYAAGLAAKKAKIDGAVFQKQCRREIDMIRFNYENGIDAVTPGMNYGSTAPFRQGVSR